MAMLDYQRVGESETTLEYDCWLLGKGSIGSELMGVFSNSPIITGNETWSFFSPGFDKSTSFRIPSGNLT